MLDSSEDGYIVDTSMPPCAVYDSAQRLVGMSVETFVLDMLKHAESLTCSIGKKSVSQQQKSCLDFIFDPVTDTEESLRERRHIALTVNCAPPGPPSWTRSVEERRESIRHADSKQAGSSDTFTDGSGGGLDGLGYARPRSCSVPRVTFEAASLQLPHGHGPLIRSATTEGAYTGSSVSKPAAPSATAAGPAMPQTATPVPQPVQQSLLTACEAVAPAHGPLCELPGVHLTILKLLYEWTCICPGDLRIREFRDFVNRLACMGDAYKEWADELRRNADLKELEKDDIKPNDLEAIHDEYSKPGMDGMCRPIFVFSGEGETRRVRIGLAKELYRYWRFPVPGVPSLMRLV
ncbi:hypothetical protein MRX96_058587 [Rhipicephalus microplus]